ncbi:hypothetical protein [Embleya scabrispora]|uniref:hypothetical protein n=1 Tax=Embleya scabrispora TaxID=159449 RepID=UPI0003AA02EB|nr:hypothetical protein [Embleya scabrispora]MYS79756.1 hypothetical protein [Streptomyces sp. SID5474]
MPTPGGFARRSAAGCLLAAALVLSGAPTLAGASALPGAVTPAAVPVLASAASGPSPAPIGGSPPAPAPAGDADSAASPRGRAPAAAELRPDPPVHGHAPAEPTGPPKPAPVADPPTPQQWERFLERLAAHGARPLTDESGRAVLDVEHELLLTGGTDGLNELRSWGAEITEEDRPGVYAVRSGGRIVARYLMEPDTITPTDAFAPVTPPAFDAPPTLPKTGPSVVNLTLIALGGAGIVCAGGLLVRCFPAPRRR